MKENQKSEEVSKNPGTENNQDSSIKSSSTSQKSPATGEDKNMNEGDKFIREGHGHDYSTPVAGEDGGTEDQSESKSEKSNQNTDNRQPAEQGKTVGESSTI